MIKRVWHKIGSISKRTIESSVKRGVTKQPRGAITFQYRIFNGKVDFEEVNRLRKQFDFGNIYLLHGVAMRVNGHAVILTGPRGSGKTTVMNRLVKKKMAKPIEDGIVIIGQKNGKFFVVESGTLPWRQTRAKVKSLSPLKGHQISRSGLKSRTNFVEQTAIHEGAFSEGIASKLTPDKSSQTHTPKTIPLGKVVRVSTETDLHLPLKINGDKIETSNRSIFSNQTTIINPLQRRSRIIQQMEESVLN